MDRDLRLKLTLGGRPAEGSYDRIRRYCGLPWSGGPPETWAYRYYDAVECDSDALTQVDVVTAAVLHPGLSRSDLAYFWDQADGLTMWLRTVPRDVCLRDAD